MGIISRFFGKSDPDDLGRPGLIANLKIEEPLDLAVLFPTPPRLDARLLVDAFKSYHHSMSDARCEFDPDFAANGNIIGLVGWSNHVIRCVGFDLPMPAKPLEVCIAPSHYPQELKARARAHKAHIILYYAGYETCPLEQYVALTATAGVLAQFGAIVVVNEAAHTTFPAAALAASDSDEDIIEELRSLPLPILYCGLVKYEVEGIPGVWMRVHGAPLLGLPDFAAHTAGHHEGERYLSLFDSVLGYLRSSGSHLADGHTMQFGHDVYLRFRLPTENEPFLASDTELLVIEIITADEINH